MISILYFGRLRELLQTRTERIAVDGGPLSVGLLLAELRRRGGVWDEAFAGANRVHAAVNDAYAHDATPIRDGDEVAFFPPVTGG